MLKKLYFLHVKFIQQEVNDLQMSIDNFLMLTTTDE